MKIAFLAAANSIHSVRWIKYFSDKGHRIIWVSLAPPTTEATELIKKVDFYEIKPSPLNDINGKWAFIYFPWAILKFMEILQKTKPDVLHVHSAGTYGLVGAFSFFKPMVLTPWGSDILLTSPIKKFLIQLTVFFASSYTCDGENTFDKLVELGAEPEKIKIIRFGTDIEKFRPAKSKEQRTNSKGRISKSKSVKIISLRNLIPVYDIETLIKAAAIVIKESANWRTKTEFIIAGDGEQKAHLEKLAKDLKLKNENVKFVGNVKNNDLPLVFNSSHIYVSTSLSDSGLSASTAEAMASELPVVVTNSGDNKKWVDDNKGGFVIPCGDYQALAEKLIYLLKNPAKRKSFGKHNRKIIEEKNNYYVEMGKMEILYQSLCQK